MRRSAFTLIELITVIVVLGLIAAVALPLYLDYSLDSKKAACKGALGAMRSAIASYYNWTATDAGGGVATYPAADQLRTAGVIIQHDVPDNPFSTTTPKNSIIYNFGSKGTIYGNGTGGWCYNRTTGQIWANSKTVGVGENLY